VGYRLSDKDLMRLNLLIPISEFSAQLPQYCLPLSTIYKRLNKLNIRNPSHTRREFERTSFIQFAGELTDKKRTEKLEIFSSLKLEETINAIKKKELSFEEMIQ
tara:strand:+ start:828 stop:1139 length:312 start_codon:yes stop_codon:yes gene_type:complete